MTLASRILMINSRLLLLKNQNVPVSLVKAAAVPTPLVPCEGTRQATWTLKRAAVKHNESASGMHVACVDSCAAAEGEDSSALTRSAGSKSVKAARDSCCEDRASCASGENVKKADVSARLPSVP